MDALSFNLKNCRKVKKKIIYDRNLIGMLRMKKIVNDVNISNYIKNEKLILKHDINLRLLKHLKK